MCGGVSETMLPSLSHQSFQTAHQSAGLSNNLDLMLKRNFALYVQQFDAKLRQIYQLVSFLVNIV